jgi:hypothetical protein
MSWQSVIYILVTVNVVFASEASMLNIPELENISDLDCLYVFVTYNIPRTT